MLPNHPLAKGPEGVEKNFICRVQLKDADGVVIGECNKALRLTPTGRSYQTGKAIAHLSESHPETSVAAVAVAKPDAGKQMDIRTSLAVTSGSTTGFIAKQRALVTQCQWYVYSQQCISKRTLEDPYFRAMLNGVCTRKHGEVAHCLNGQNLGKFVEAEFGVFVLFLKEILSATRESHFGNQFAQALHDSGTLASGQKYQALGLQHITPDYSKNLLICVGFPTSPAHCSDVNTVANQFKEVVRERGGVKLEDVLIGAIQDGAALGVATELGQEEHTCLMHAGDKVGSSAVGNLVRSRNKITVNPFPGGQALLKRARAVAKLFSYNARLEELWAICRRVKVNDKIKPKLNPNTTRVAYFHSLLYSLLRQWKAHRVYMDEKGVPEGARLTDEQWSQLKEMEAVLDVTRKLTVIAQNENAYTEAYAPLVKTQMLDALRADSMECIDLAAVGEKRPERILVAVADFSGVGKTCRARALREAVRRFGQDGAAALPDRMPGDAPLQAVLEREEKVMQEAVVSMSANERVAALLDLRLVQSSLMTPEQRRLGLDDFLAGYAEYAFTAEKYLEDKAEAKAAGRAVEQAVDGAGGAPPRKRAKPLPDFFGDGEDDDNDGEMEAPVLTREEKDAALFAKCEAEARRVHKRFRRMASGFDWAAEFPEECRKGGALDVDEIEDLDAIDNLLSLDVMKVYKRMAEKKDEYGWIPAMARARLGSVMAESFCERVRSCAYNVVTEGNSLLNAKQVEMVCVLRMNRDFMEYMRTEYRAGDHAWKTWVSGADLKARVITH